MKRTSERLTYTRQLTAPEKPVHGRWNNAKQFVAAQTYRRMLRNTTLKWVDLYSVNTRRATYTTITNLKGTSDLLPSEWYSGNRYNWAGHQLPVGGHYHSINPLSHAIDTLTHISHAQLPILSNIHKISTVAELGHLDQNDRSICNIYY